MSNSVFTRLFLWVFLLLVASKTSAQSAVIQTSSKIKLIVNGDSTLKNLYKKTGITQDFFTLSEARKELSGLVFKLNLAGYLLAGIDSFTQTSGSIYAHISVGNPMSLLSVDVADSFVLPINGEFQKRNHDSHWASWWVKYAQQLVFYYENNGYPFASVQLIPTSITPEGVKCRLQLTKNEYIIYDSIEIIGSAEVSMSYMEQYLSIVPLQPYNESHVQEIVSKLNGLPWIEQVKPVEIYFIGNRAVVRLYIDKKPAGSLDAVLGLSPGSELTGEKILLTGEAHLRLVNLFKRGYALDIDYTSFRASSKEFKARTLVPYLFKTAIGTEASFNLIKFDSLYLEVIADLGILYQLNANKLIKLYFKNQSVSLLQLDTQEAIANLRLPDFNDVRTRKYGLSLKQVSLDNIRNPRKGWSLDIDASLGSKTIVELDGLKQLDLYKNVLLKSIQYQSFIQLKTYMPISRYVVWHLRTQAAQIYAPQIFYNDLYRIGGLKTVKGFDEQSILASSYVFANTELRYLFAKYSNAMVFINGGWWENNSINIYKNGYPIGIGVGSNLETSKGNFSIYYALGKEIGNRFIVKNGKVHFGYINYF